MDSNPTPTQDQPHPQAHIWLIVTMVVVVLGLIIMAYYLAKARQTLESKRAAKPTPIATTTSTPTPAASTEPVTISKDSSPKKVAAEIKKINVNEIKQSVKELQTALAALTQ